jgi:hypothetical protein
VDERGDSAPTISADVKEGVYRILFNHDRVGYNMSSQNDWILPAIEAVPSGGFSLQAKTSIEKDYNDQIGDLQKEIAELTGIKDVVLDPNFEENYQALLALPDTKWHANFGKVHFAYFDGLKKQLESQGLIPVHRGTVYANSVQVSRRMRCCRRVSKKFWSPRLSRSVL